jgi:hypothetical protein
MTGALAVRPFVNEADTGIEDVLGDLPIGSLPELKDMIALSDFDWAARHYLPVLNYTYYRNGVGGEWSYRNNLEVFGRYRFKPRVMVDITKIASSLPYGGLKTIPIFGEMLTCMRVGPQFWATTSQLHSTLALAQEPIMATRNLRSD